MQFSWFRMDQLRQGVGWDRLSGQLPPHPPWALKWATVAATLVFFIPLALLALAAMATFFLVFLVMSLVGRLAGWIGRAGRPADDGRRNVRVVGTGRQSGNPSGFESRTE